MNHTNIFRCFLVGLMYVRVASIQYGDVEKRYLDSTYLETVALESKVARATSQRLEVEEIKSGLLKRAAHCLRSIQTALTLDTVSRRNKEFFIVLEILVSGTILPALTKLQGNDPMFYQKVAAVEDIILKLETDFVLFPKFLPELDDEEAFTYNKILTAVRVKRNLILIAENFLKEVQAAKIQTTTQQISKHVINIKTKKPLKGSESYQKISKTLSLLLSHLRDDILPAVNNFQVDLVHSDDNLKRLGDINLVLANMKKEFGLLKEAMDLISQKYAAEISTIGLDKDDFNVIAIKNDLLKRAMHLKKQILAAKEKFTKYGHVNEGSKKILNSLKHDLSILESEVIGKLATFGNEKERDLNEMLEVLGHIEAAMLMVQLSFNETVQFEEKPKASVGIKESKQPIRIEIHRVPSLNTPHSKTVEKENGKNSEEISVLTDRVWKVMNNVHSIKNLLLNTLIQRNHKSKIAKESKPQNKTGITPLLIEETSESIVHQLNEMDAELYDFITVELEAISADLPKSNNESNLRNFSSVIDNIEKLYKHVNSLLMQIEKVSSGKVALKDPDVVNEILLNHIEKHTLSILCKIYLIAVQSLRDKVSSRTVANNLRRKKILQLLTTLKDDLEKDIKSLAEVKVKKISEKDILRVQTIEKSFENTKQVFSQINGIIMPKIRNINKVAKRGRSLLALSPKTTQARLMKEIDLMDVNIVLTIDFVKILKWTTALKSHVKTHLNSLEENLLAIQNSLIRIPEHASLWSHSFDFIITQLDDVEMFYLQLSKSVLAGFLHADILFLENNMGVYYPENLEQLKLYLITLCRAYYKRIKISILNLSLSRSIPFSYKSGYSLLLRGLLQQIKALILPDLRNVHDSAAQFTDADFQTISIEGKALLNIAVMYDQMKHSYTEMKNHEYDEYFTYGWEKFLKEKDRLKNIIKRFQTEDSELTALIQEISPEYVEVKDKAKFLFILQITRKQIRNYILKLNWHYEDRRQVNPMVLNELMEFIGIVKLVSERILQLFDEDKGVAENEKGKGKIDKESATAVNVGKFNINETLRQVKADSGHNQQVKDDDKMEMDQMGDFDSENFFTEDEENAGDFEKKLQLLKAANESDKAFVEKYKDLMHKKDRSQLVIKGGSDDSIAYATKVIQVARDHNRNIVVHLETLGRNNDLLHHVKVQSLKDIIIKLDLLSQTLDHLKRKYLGPPGSSKKGEVFPDDETNLPKEASTAYKDVVQSSFKFHDSPIFDYKQTKLGHENTIVRFNVQKIEIGTEMIFLLSPVLILISIIMLVLCLCYYKIRIKNSKAVESYNAYEDSMYPEEQEDLLMYRS